MGSEGTSVIGLEHSERPVVHGVLAYSPTCVIILNSVDSAAPITYRPKAHIAMAYAVLGCGDMACAVAGLLMASVLRLGAGPPSLWAAFLWLRMACLYNVVHRLLSRLSCAAFPDPVGVD